ncbi:hypothetical protein AYI69_g4967, partial [Smittium culicis]
MKVRYYDILIIFSFAKTSLGPEETESPCTGAELQNGVSLLDLPTDTQERLHDVTGSRRCFYAHSNPRILQEVPPLLLEWESVPVQSAAVRTITESPHVYKDSSPGFDMGENTRNPGICISGRSIDPGRIEGEMRIEYSQGSGQANGSWLQNKDGKIDNEAMSIDNASWNGNKLSRNESESTFLKDKGPQKGSFEITEDWQNDSEEPSEFHRQGTSNVNSITSWTPHATPNIGTEECMSVEEESMGIDGDIDRASNSESTILGHSTDIMEWPIIPPRDARARSFYGFERLGMGNSGGIQILLRIMESIGGVDAHQRQRIIDNIIRSSTQECYRPISISLLRKYYHIGLRQKIWRDNLTTAVRDIGKDLETLFRYEHTPTSHICAVCDESSRRSQSFNRADRM